MYGAEYVPDSPRRYEKKVKNAQEAHEAIRPAGDSFRTPAQVAGELRGDEFALYELIWKRTVASQMADARGSTATVKLGATLAMPGDGAARVVEFSASGTVITFRGFLAAYEEGRDDEETAARSAAALLPTGSVACRSSTSVSRSTCCARRRAGTRPRLRPAIPRQRW
jgi:DNA topoisomerase-1